MCVCVYVRPFLQFVLKSARIVVWTQKRQKESRRLIHHRSGACRKDDAMFAAVCKVALERRNEHLTRKPARIPAQPLSLCCLAVRRLGHMCSVPGGAGTRCAVRLRASSKHRMTNIRDVTLSTHFYTCRCS